MCLIDGCEKQAVGRGWCPAHWYRWSKHGDPVGGRDGPAVSKAVDHDDGTRTCTKCDERKPLESFAQVKMATLGRRSDCGACRSAQMKSWYLKNQDRQAARQRERRAADPEHAREIDRAAYLRDYEKKREASDISTAKRRSAISGAQVDTGVTRANLRNQYGDDCFYCQTPMNFKRREKRDHFPRDMATLDHVVPVARGGTHTWDNVVLACWDCNIAKHARPLDEWLDSRPPPSGRLGGTAPIPPSRQPPPV